MRSACSRCREVPRPGTLAMLDGLLLCPACRKLRRQTTRINRQEPRYTRDDEVAKGNREWLFSGAFDAEAYKAALRIARLRGIHDVKRLSIEDHRRFQRLWSDLMFLGRFGALPQDEAKHASPRVALPDRAAVAEALAETGDIRSETSEPSYDELAEIEQGLGLLLGS